MNQLALVKDNSIEYAVIEQVVINGDLQKLNPQQRVTYYNRVCETMGLNPYTRPFDYIVLNGKMTLYATKNCTEQLRKLNGVSIEKIESKVIDDLYIVQVSARDKHGRLDASTGAVTIGHLKGDAKANAIMKAETKAKRRVTLSISGLGWIDESETDSIPGAKKVEVDMNTGELLTEGSTNKYITKEQWLELNSLIKECSQEFQDKIWKRLESLQVIEFSDLETDIFIKIKSACQGHVNKNKQTNGEKP